ncbi:MAG TPA: bifunctional diaminohydroxyphosphoribosylaminopyrimidine deaminase/5-amino-6-(5-phosphoribosylamino)uracil reductase RibD [Actinomycetes bacterium]|nr:bifunctional diaminohydroxyphosphoribosylaminopyrimidine deaminase/5-amino-6-(5-phosphoribosylamino)uracil reductase RibD [Actinomycetes bacterium]
MLGAPEPEWAGTEMASTIEIDAMQRALSLATRAEAPTHPNPRVGAVVLDAAGSIVGEGFHRGAGTPHAEIEALRDAGPSASGATVVVSLEPCNHSGRTEPCTASLLQAGVSRVVFAQTDPNPVAAGGAEVLRGAGLSVEGGVLSERARELNPIWTLAMQRQRPFVTWKVAATVDGRVAASDGSSRWITGSSARAEVHALRAQVDAVVVGTGTVLEDDPQLTARDAEGQPIERQPLRVVVGHRSIPASAKVNDDSAETLHLPSHEPTEVLEELFARDVHHTLLEGGPTLAAAFVSAGAVDRVVGYTAPALLGDGASLLGPIGVASISDAVRFAFDDVSLVDGDLRWSGRLSDVPLFTEGAR